LTDVLGAPLFRLATLATRSVSHFRTRLYPPFDQPVKGLGRARTRLEFKAYITAHKYGVSTYQLALVNEATISDNCDNLEPNQEICLGIEGHDCTKVYTVVANE
jgi:hypothetical protein